MWGFVARPGAARGWAVAPSISILLCSVAVLSCGTDEGARGPATTVPGERAEASPLVPPPPVEALPGAAAEAMTAETPEDIEGLATRFVPRPLPIPNVRAGRSAGFTFDGDRHGWFARLPEYRGMKLVTPVYGRGRVYVGGGFESHKFYGIDAESGRIDWVANAEDGGPTAAIVEDDEVIFNTESCTLFVVDAETGRLKWKRWLGDPLMGQPAAAGGRVFSGHIRDGGGYGFTAMNLENGRVLWTRNVTSDVMNAPVLDDEDIYFTTMDGVVWSLSQETGRLRWRQRLGASSAPWLDGERVHVARRRVVQNEETGRRQRKEQAVVLAKADGTTVRETDPVDAAFVPARPDSGGVEAGWVYEGSRPTVVDGRSYQTIGHEVQSRDAETGELLWRRRYTEAGRGRPASPPAVAGSQLVFGTRDGVLYGLDIDTGLTAWAYDVGEPITAQPTAARGWVYASTVRGGVIGIQVSDPSVGGWHMWGGNSRHNGPAAEPPEAEPSGGEDDRPGEGVLRLAGAAHEGELAGFPLTGTRVRARVSGFVARVEVEQTFENPYERPVEAVYLFPLPDDAAVDAMELRTGDRVVQGRIRRREEARREYRRARDRGVLASLLEQERPNLFRQSLANVRPGDEVKVVLHYTQVMPFEEGNYRFVYPMVAGPRYVPEAHVPEAHRGAGASSPGGGATEGSDIHQVAIADGSRRRDRVHFTIEVDAGSELFEVTSPTHELEVERGGPNEAMISLGEQGVAPDRDLDVRLRTAGDAPSVALLTSPPEEGRRGYLTLLLHPRLAVPEQELARRELVFVVDTSSSMNGRPMDMAKAAMREALDGLREGDTFRIVRFSDVVDELSEAALPATAENVRRGRRFVDGMRALGATEMTRGLRAALDAPAEDQRMRIVLLLTDGYIGNESDVLREVDGRLGQSRVFAFGVGSAVNRYLLTRLAEIGRGDVSVVTLDESPEAAAKAFHERIASPHLTDIRIDWGGLAVDDVYPRRAPDLYADRPLVVHGRFGEGGEGTVVVRGRIAGHAFERRVPVTLPAAGEGASRAELSSIWARTRIRDLMTAMTLRPSDVLREEITTIGLRHSLMTQWTSFVAVDEGYRTDDEGRPVRVDQAGALPSGVEWGGAARRAEGFRAATRSYAPTGRTTMDAARSPLAMDDLVGRAVGVRGIGASIAGPEPAEASRPSGRPRPTASGDEDQTADLRASLVRGVAVHRPRLARCYDAALRAQPGLSGRVVLGLTVAGDGTVSRVTLRGDILDAPGLRACLLSAARGLRLPAPGRAGLQLSYPLLFRPPDG